MTEPLETVGLARKSPGGGRLGKGPCGMSLPRPSSSPWHRVGHPGGASWGQGRSGFRRRLSRGLCFRADIEEKGVRMKLTVIDTPGFGDHINNENW